jgi:hypothetical protein
VVGFGISDLFEIAFDTLETAESQNELHAAVPTC